LKSRKRDWKEVREALQSILEHGKDYDNRILSFLYLVLRHLSDSMGDDFRKSPEKILTEFALERTLLSCFRKAAGLSPGTTPSYVGDREDLLLKILLSHNSFFLEGVETAIDVAGMERLFTDRDVREFLLVHQSEGVEWFNRERFEGLMHALYLTALSTLLSKESASTGTISESIRIYKEVQEFCDMAEKSCYRTQQFLNKTE
jgi:hypothetical protein